MTLLVGTIRDARGNLMIIDGSIWFQINQNGSALPGACGGPFEITPMLPSVYTLVDGEIAAGSYITGNDCITPMNTYYRVDVVSEDGVIVLRRSLIVTGDTFDIGDPGDPEVPPDVVVVGPTGPTGPTGPIGLTGPQGPAGADGEDGVGGFGIVQDEGVDLANQP